MIHRFRISDIHAHVSTGSVHIYNQAGHGDDTWNLFDKYVAHIYMSKGERLASSNLYIFEDLNAWVGLCA